VSAAYPACWSVASLFCYLSVPFQLNVLLARKWWLVDYWDCGIWFYWVFRVDAGGN
jgi:hypothetical protein